MEQRKLSGMELASFCGQLALILRSGISAVEGIVTMLEDTVSDAEKDTTTACCLAPALSQ